MLCQIQSHDLPETSKSLVYKAVKFSHSHCGLNFQGRGRIIQQEHQILRKIRYKKRIDDNLQSYPIGLSSSTETRALIPGEDIECLCSHQNVCEGELAFSEGEILQVVAEQLDQSWLTARNSRGQKGSVPRCNVRICHYEQLIKRKHSTETDQYLESNPYGYASSASKQKRQPLPPSPPPPLPPQSSTPIRNRNEVELLKIKHQQIFEDDEVYQEVPSVFDETSKELSKSVTSPDYEWTDVMEEDETCLTYDLTEAKIETSRVSSEGPSPIYDDYHMELAEEDDTYGLSDAENETSSVSSDHPAPFYDDFYKHQDSGGCSLKHQDDSQRSEDPLAIVGEVYDDVALPGNKKSSVSTKQHDPDVDRLKLQEGVQRSELWTPGQPVECLCNHDAIYSNDLPFCKGDILTIVSATLDKTLYFAKDIHGREGTIRTNFVQKYKTETYMHDNYACASEPSVEVQEIWTPGQLVECVFNSDGLHDGDFSISKGDILRITRATKDKKWYLAENVQGREGFVRTSCVRKHLDLLANQASIYALDGYSSINTSLIEDEKWYFAKNTTGGKDLFPVYSEEKFENVENYVWFHEKIDREVSESLLQQEQDGTFLIRYTSLSNAVYALSLRCKDRIHHIPIRNSKDKLTIDGRCIFKRLTELVKHYTENADNLPSRLIKACAKAGGQVSENSVSDLKEKFTAAVNEAKRIHPFGGNTVETAVVRFLYVANNTDELSLTEGDIINILSKDLEDYGWWIGECFGHIGAFPCTHVKVIKEVVQIANQRVKCLVNFSATKDEHLPFSRREILTIVSKHKDEEWYFAKNVTGMKGLIPAHCVEKCENVEAYTWFHGNINPEVCDNLLQPQQDGLFLVRYSPISVADYVLTVCCEERNFHFLIRNDRYGLNIDGRCNFNTLAELVEHYTKEANGLPTRLIKPCVKAGGLPPEILCMDEDAQNLYREALAAGKEKVYNIRVMIVGHHGVGKTALTKRLLGENINENEREPTEGVEVYDRCCQIDHDTRKWKPMITDSHPVNDQRILGIVQNHLNLKQGHTGNDTSTRNIAEFQAKDARTNRSNNYYKVEPIYHTIESITDRAMNISLDTTIHPSSSEEKSSLNLDDSKQSMDSIQSEQSKLLSTPVATDVMGVSTGIWMPLYTRAQSKSSTEIRTINPESFQVNMGSVENKQRRISRSRAENYTMISLDTTKNATEEIQKFIEGSRPLNFSGSKMSDVTMLDFSGHFMFYTTHQAFMSWRTQYILVTDMTLPLNDAVKEDKCDMDISGDRICSPLEYMMYWLNAIHSHSCFPSENELSTNKKNPGGKSDCQQETTSSSPPVILVATHADKIPKKELQMRKRTYFEKVKEAVHDRPLRFHLIKEEFAITNIGPDSEIDALKSKILEIAKKQDYWGEEVPARWLLLEQVLMELKRHGTVIIDYNEVEFRNQSLQVKIESSEELQLFLRFEHDLGNIVYLSTEKLRGKIVLQPQWLINGLKVLIASEHIVKNYPDLQEYWCKFRDTGQLAKRLLDVLWSHHSDYHHNQHHLLDLMEKLNIIAKPRKLEDEKQEDDCYWVPCMVHKTATEDVRMLGEGDDVKKTSTLCFKSKTKFIHVAVFHRLLASCLSKWSPATDGEKYLLFSGLCVFELDDCHNMMLSMNDYVINVTMIRFSNKVYPDKLLCIKTRDFLQTTLSEIASYLCPCSEFEICIKCNKSSPQKNDGLHNISSLRKNEEVRCSGHGVIHRVESNELLQFWEANDAKLPKNVLTTQSALATDRFMRIYSVVVDVGTKILRRLLHYYTVTPHCSLDQYLKNYTPIILDLKKKKVLNPSQINIIFPQTSDTDIRRYDITLLSALLNNIVPGLGQTEKQCVDDLRKHRNKLMHVTSTRLGINDFQSMWTTITTTLTDLSKLCRDTTFEEEIKTEIQDVQTSASSDILSRMDSVEEELKQMHSDVSEIKKHSAPADQVL